MATDGILKGDFGVFIANEIVDILTENGNFLYVFIYVDVGAICDKLVNHRAALHQEIQHFVKEFEVCPPKPMNAPYVALRL
jgi:hypothetical protein